MEYKNNIETCVSACVYQMYPRQFSSALERHFLLDVWKCSDNFVHRPVLLDSAFRLSTRPDGTSPSVLAAASFVLELSAESTSAVLELLLTPLSSSAEGSTF